MDVPEYGVTFGQAVQITYQTNNNTKTADVIRAEIINAFGYDSYDGAVSSIDEVPPVQSFDWLIGLIAAVLLGLVAAIVYMAFRFSKSAIFVVFLQMALDIFITLALVLICRVTVNLTFGDVLLTVFALSLINSFVYYNKVREDRKVGLTVGMSNAEVANKTTKQTLWKKIIFYVAMILASLLFVLISVGAVRDVFAGIILALITTFYTSTFLLPSFWSLVDKPKKAKKKA